MTTKVYLSSPVEPSGASWLINCFLELGIKVSHKPIVDNAWRHATPAPSAGHMWQRAPDGRFRLRARADVLKKWLPALSRHDAFAFRDDIEIEYVQDLPASHHEGAPVLLFVRDPRDSLYSMYRRMQPDLDYDTFLRIPNADTLYDRPSHWRLFVERWLSLADGRRFTFEEYKQDAAGLLERIVRCVGISCDREQIARAAHESRYEAARAAEERYKARFPGDWEVANRAGRPGEWRQGAESRSGAALIESRAGSLMRRLGYDCSAPCDDEQGARLEELRSFAAAVDEAFLRCTSLPNHRIRQLLDSLAQLGRTERWDCSERLVALRERFAEGSDHQFAQMRDLLARRRPNG